MVMSYHLGFDNRACFRRLSVSCVANRVLQERETRAKLKKEKEEVILQLCHQAR